MCESFIVKVYRREWF